MRKIAKIAALLAAFSLTLGFMSCDNSSDGPGYVPGLEFTVKYSTERGTAPEAIKVLSGTALTAKQLPALTADGYDFGGWYDGTTKAEAGKYIVTKNVTLTAKWTSTRPPATTLDLSTVTADTTVADGMTITGTLANNVKISIADGATVTLKNASINADGTWKSGDYAGLNCVGDATITLEAGTTNTVKGFKITYPGIHVPSGKTLTINGTGALTVSPNTSGAEMSPTGAGIGGGVGLPCGNIVIAGGTITASTANLAAAIGSGGNNYGDSQTCGNISITGGTVTATCLALRGPGIGAGYYGICGDISITGGTVTATGASEGSCGAGIGCGGGNSTVRTITIADTVTKVTATAGTFGGNSAKSIGKGRSGTSYVGSCGTIKIGGTPYADGISDSPYTYPSLKFIDLGDAGKFYYSDGDTWTDARGRSENDSCLIELADLEHAIFKFHGSDYFLCVGTGSYDKVLPDDVINGDLTYSWQD